MAFSPPVVGSLVKKRLAKKGAHGLRPWWKSTFISIFWNTKLRDMQHQIFSHKLLLKEKNLNVLLRPFYSVLLFFFSFVILNFIITRTKNLYGINNKSNGVRVVAVITRRPYCPGRRKSFVLPRLTPYGFHCDAWRGKTKLFWSPGTIWPPCDKAEVRTYIMTCVTNKLQMNPVQQFFPNLHNRTSVNQLFQAQLASSKRSEIWQTLRFTNKL